MMDSSNDVTLIKPDKTRVSLLIHFQEGVGFCVIDRFINPMLSLSDRPDESARFDVGLLFVT